MIELHLEDLTRQDTIEWTGKFNKIVYITKWTYQQIEETVQRIVNLCILDELDHEKTTEILMKSLARQRI